MTHSNFEPPLVPEDWRDSSADARRTRLAVLGGRIDVPGAKGPKAPPALTKTPDVFALLRALRQRWALALGLGSVVAVSAALAAWVLVPSPKYKATALLKVEMLPPKVLFPTSENQPDFKTYQATQLALLTSRLVLNAALRRPGVAEMESVREQADPVDWLERQLVVELPVHSELLRISISGDRSRELAILTNAVADSYMEEIVTKEHRERFERHEKLQKLYADRQAALSTKRATQRKLAEVVGSDNRQNLALQQKIKLEQLAVEQKELLKVQLDLKRERVELTVLEAAEASKAITTVPDSAIDEQVENDELITRQKFRIIEIKQKINRGLRLARNPNDPSLRPLRTELANTERALSTDRERLRPKIARQFQEMNRGEQATRLADLRVQIQMNSGLENVLLEGIERLNHEAKTFNTKTMDLQSLQDEIEQIQAVANKIGNEVEYMNVEKDAAQRVRLLERADDPRVENPRKRLMAVAAAAFGMFACTVLGVSWREYRTRRVDSIDEVVNGLGLRLVGTLPALPDRPGRGAAVPRLARESLWQNMLIESIDAARTMLLHDCRLESYRVLMITSAMPGEGKSPLASHLAISLARTGRRTLLVDLDLRNPSVHRLFDVPPDVGVCELLRGEVPLEKAAQPVLSDLDVIPAGRCDAASIRALAQDRLAFLFEDLRQRYDFIIVDSAPVLTVADSLLVSQYVDAAVFSVCREISRLPTVYAGYERLARLGTRLLGVVVTGIPAERFGGEDRYAV